MDISHVVARMVADCDFRNRFLRQFPNLLDNYLLSEDGQIIIREPGVQVIDKYLFDGLSFASSKIRV